MRKVARSTDLDATRDRLLEAAVSVFADNGFRAATVREICAKATVNIAAVNYHFGDKLGLYSEVLKRAAGIDEQLKIREAMAECASPTDALRVFVRAMLEKICRDEGPDPGIKIMVQELANPTPALSSVVDLMIRPQYEQLCDLIAQVTGARCNDTKTRLCVHSLLGQVTHYAQSRTILTRVWPELRLTPDMRAKIADHILEFTLSGLKATKPKSQKRRVTAK